MRGRAEEGLTLVELLVSMTILASAMMIALMLYDGARRSFKVGENVAEQQQAVRIAFDMMNADLRMAGFNTNPDGNKARPDEQIEAAFATGIVIRADFDRMDPTNSVTPEATLAGGSFLSVSTGNDEIVGYVLAKADGSSSDQLVFRADVDPPVRDGVVEPVALGPVDLAQNAPPYTLYRVTWDDNANPVRTPLIENVRRLEFRYFDRRGLEVAPVGGDDTPEARDLRASIRRIRIDIEGLTRDPDAVWRDRTDTNPDTRAFRKFRLSGDVTPRNIGWSGLKDFQVDNVPPQQPASPTLHSGHCDGLYVEWPANPPEDEVAYYRVSYTGPFGNSDWHPAAETGCYIGGLQPSTDYSVSIQAVDAAGNQSPLSAAATAPPTENVLPSNVPSEPMNLSATTNLKGKVDLAWEEVTTNFGATPGDPSSPMIRDLAGYRIYRAGYAGFSADPSNRIADESDILALPTPQYPDTSVVNCRDYFYRVAAVDRCGEESLLSVESSGAGWSDAMPRPPLSTNAFFSGPATVRVVWDEVREDIFDDEIFVQDYIVHRTGPMSDATDPATLSNSDFVVSNYVIGGTEYLDTGLLLGPGQTVFYRVVATDDCSPANESDPSFPASPACYFSGTPTIRNPSYGDLVWGNTPVEVEVVGGSGSYSAARLTISEDGGTNSMTYAVPVTGTTAVFNWNAHPTESPPIFFQQGRWRITAEVDQLILGGPAICTATTQIRVDVGS